ncbi:MAG: hypothetical protein NVS3B20_21720 [Polyangiales bacterium]
MLFVGDLRRACVFEVPSLRLLAMTPEVRPYFGHAADDLQNIVALFSFANDSALALATADGSVGVYQLTSGNLVWKGTGEIYQRDDLLYVINENRDQLMTMGRSLAFSTTRALTDAEKSSDTPISELVGIASPPSNAYHQKLVGSYVCHVGPWLFPRAACERSAD